jgi:molybdopterin-guanine dinucleotide biosynthesis protein B
VAIVSGHRWALVNELRGAPEPSLETVLAALGPCDLILVEGYKGAPIPKVEARRGATRKQQPLAPEDANVIAIAADHAADGAGRPVFALDDIAGLADFLTLRLGLGAGSAKA